jgi:hypothetical protein
MTQRRPALSSATATPHFCPDRRGAVIVLAAFLLILVFACAAIAVDLAYLRVTRAELRNAADAAALAAGGVLRDTGSEAEARAAAVAYAAMNTAGGQPVVLDPAADVFFGRRVFNDATGSYEFVPGDRPFDSVQVFARRTEASRNGPVGLFFGRALGKDTAQVGAHAAASFLPRDIGLVIDLSGSMLYDSTLLHEDVTAINNRAIWVALGSRTFGVMNDWNDLRTLTGSTGSIISALGLTAVPYPYPGGSWSEYVTYVKTDSRLPTRYRDKYGLKTFIDYVLQRRSFKTSTPALSDTPEQPVTALKQAVTIMLDYLGSLDTEEHVSLSTYDTLARIERDLTTDLTGIDARMQYMQAGHYYRETNIGDGIRHGRESLTGPAARPEARRVLILFSDGRANEPGTEAYARSYALDQARLTAEQDITIHTISFTSLADVALMSEIARIGKGVHYHVPAYDIDQYTEDLRRVLLTLSSIRPLVLSQ